MIWTAVIGLALAATPPSSAHRTRCDIGPIPDATIAYTEQGKVWILDGGKTVTEQDLGSRIPAGAKAHCTGTKIRFMADLETRATLGFQTMTVDFAEIFDNLETEVADPRRMDAANSLRGLDEGDLTAWKALQNIPPTFWNKQEAAARAARGLHQKAKTQTVSDALATMMEGLRTIGGLPRVSQDFSQKDRSAILIDIGGWLFKSGQYGEAVTVLNDLLDEDPNHPPQTLALADAYWELGDKRRARAWYLKANKLAVSMPARAIERCPKCR